MYFIFFKFVIFRKKFGITGLSIHNKVLGCEWQRHEHHTEMRFFQKLLWNAGLKQSLQASPWRGECVKTGINHTVSKYERLKIFPILKGTKKSLNKVILYVWRFVFI